MNNLSTYFNALTVHKVSPKPLNTPTEKVVYYAHPQTCACNCKGRKTGTFRYEHKSPVERDNMNAPTSKLVGSTQYVCGTYSIL